jgi:hypothetical protein
MDTAALKKCTRRWLHHTEPLQHSHMATCCHEEHHWCSLLATKDFYPTLSALVPWFMACTHGASKNLDNAALHAHLTLPCKHKANPHCIVAHGRRPLSQWSLRRS